MTTDRTPSSAGGGATPMIAQYLEIKAVNPDCLLFYRMGDFYEMFFDDAEVASQALGIVLTKRGRHAGADIAMCGVPVERADDYLHRLIGLGHRVAVCEQIEDPAEARKRGGKSVVKRDVVRLVTPGTITEERLLEPRKANCLMALGRTRAGGGDLFGVAIADISTGVFHVCDGSFAEALAQIARIEPSEVIVAAAILEDPPLAAALRQAGRVLTPAIRETQGGRAADQRLQDYFGVATLDGMAAFSRAEIAAAALLLAFVERTQMASRPLLAPPQRWRAVDFMEIDAATRANLELTATLAGQRQGSLLATIDRCRTGGGARLLHERLGAPLTSAAEIGRRLDAVAWLAGLPALRASARQLLAEAPDAIRALGRLALGRGGPRDLAHIRDALAAAACIGDALAAAGDAEGELQQAAAELRAADPAMQADIAAMLVESPALKTRDGDFVRPGALADLDAARSLRDESRLVIAALQARYARETDIKQLKIRHNHFLGYYIEVAQAQGERLMRPPFDTCFIHRQTMADAMRFSTGELATLASRIAAAAEQALAIEAQVFERLAAQACAQEAAIRRVCAALAVVDVAAGLAEMAAQADWVRPQIDHSLRFEIEGGRHPVVEAALRAKGASFVGNGCTLSNGGKAQLAIVTGPNMAGKSTFLRQNALIAVLAQAGSFVPAAAARIGIVDRLFSRVGAADDLARGRSTFMVEMVETAAILNQATERSLVILDEIGRGTATFDGLSIAWATMEHLHDKSRARTLFATHFHELTQLAGRLERLANLTMRVTEWNGELVFLHEVAPGAADRSYGIQVARLAGLPASVVARARALLAEIEAGNRQAPVSRMLAELPLFAAIAAPPPRPDVLAQALDALDPDELSPKAAHEALYELKRLRREEAGENQNPGRERRR